MTRLSHGWRSGDRGRGVRGGGVGVRGSLQEEGRKGTAGKMVIFRVDSHVEPVIPAASCCDCVEYEFGLVWLGCTSLLLVVDACHDRGSTFSGTFFLTAEILQLRNEPVLLKCYLRLYTIFRFTILGHGIVDQVVFRVRAKWRAPQMKSLRKFLCCSHRITHRCIPSYFNMSCCVCPRFHGNATTTMLPQFSVDEGRRRQDYHFPLLVSRLYSADGVVRLCSKCLL